MGLRTLSSVLTAEVYVNRRREVNLIHLSLRWWLLKSVCTTQTPVSQSQHCVGLGFFSRSASEDSVCCKQATEEPLCLGWSDLKWNTVDAKNAVEVIAALYLDFEVWAKHSTLYFPCWALDETRPVCVRPMRWTVLEISSQTLRYRFLELIER